MLKPDLQMQDDAIPSFLVASFSEFMITRHLEEEEKSWY